ncbi:hypothetical protein D9758_014493 [Tetrapyrgos nigripes]|uniref:Uncharacterized protein n=1 Tax=Tetrapyrgos nigripes TaxID=182062 RepID=A0A8H5C6Q5_9AGAR|nr:hypothetical protein D9758_014493 [Tetrapyrgos nigripes]
MRSFSIFTTLAAFAAVSYAALPSVGEVPSIPAMAPVPGLQGINGVSAMKMPSVPAMPTIPDANSMMAVPKLIARCDCRSLPDIINDAITQVSPLVAQLKSLTPTTCTVEKVTPIISKIKDVISSAITEVKTLISAKISDAEALASTTTTGATASANSVLSHIELCKLIATLYTLIFSSFTLVLNIVAKVEYNGICGLFAEVATLLATLLQLICSLVGGLTLILHGLLSVDLSVIIELNLTDAFSFIFKAIPGY